MANRAIISSRKDVETLDFIISVINAYSNCDTWGVSDVEEKWEMCDEAKDFLYKYIKIKDDKEH